MPKIILGMKIRKLVFLDDQEALNPDYRARGIRLDIYAEDEANTVYNVEMPIQSPWSRQSRMRSCIKNGDVII